MRFANGGVKNIEGLKIIDAITTGTEYVLNSLNQMGIGPLTDASDDGAGYYGEESSVLLFCVNNGNAPGTGGSLLTNASGSVTFDVIIDPLASGNITNTLLVVGDNFDSFTEQMVINVAGRPVVSGAEFYVDDDNPFPAEPYDSLATAGNSINAVYNYVDSVYGGNLTEPVTIWINDGLYYESIHIDNIGSSSNYPFKMIRYSGTPDIFGSFLIEDAHYVTLDGLTIWNNGGSDVIRTDNSKGPTTAANYFKLLNCDIYSANPTNGRMLYISTDTIDAEIKYNTFHGGHTGIAVRDNSHLIRSNTFYDMNRPIIFM